jgi:hypothetical protein
LLPRGEAGFSPLKKQLGGREAGTELAGYHLLVNKFSWTFLLFVYKVVMLLYFLQTRRRK